MKTKWAKNAPACLIRAYKERKIGNGHNLLGRLLGKDSEWIESPWTQISRHVRSDQQWLRVWTAIAYAKSQSNRALRSRRKTRGDERNEYHALATKFANLANQIENGPLDILTHELWSPEDWAALNVANLNEMDAKERFDAAHQILKYWPSATDLLRGLGNRASTLASDAMTKPRPDERDRGDIEGRVFLWHLAKEFQLIFGKQMLGTLANIANVTFNRVGKSRQFEKSFVQSLLRTV